MTRQATSYLDMAGLWDLQGFIASSESAVLFSALQDVRKLDRDAKHAELIAIIRNKSAEEILRVYAAKAQTIITRADNKAISELKGILLDRDNGIYLRTAVSQSLRSINHKDAVYALISALAHTYEPGLHNEIAYAVCYHPALSWQEKTDRLLQTLNQDTLYREHLPLEAMLRAILPPLQTLQGNRFELTDYLINKSPAWSEDERMIGILAGLIIESVGRNLNRANQRAHQYQLAQPDEGLRLRPLVSEMNSHLTPAELEVRLQTSFYDPLEKANKRIQAMWENSIEVAQNSIRARTWIGGFLFVSGLILLGITVYHFLTTQRSSESLMGLVVSSILLVMATIYSGPLRHVRQALAEIGVANTVYAAYVQRSLEISNSFARNYVQGKLDADDIAHSNKLISDAMNDTVKALRNSGPASLDDLINQLSSS